MSDSQPEGYVGLHQLRGLSMLTLRANLSATKIKSGIKKATGLDFPKRGMHTSNGAKSLGWMSPDELLIIVDADECVQTIENLNKALVGQHILLEDMSDARAMFRLSGKNIREVLAKLVPFDTSHSGFAVGSLVRTRFAQVAGAAFMTSNDTVELMCFRSVQDYVFGLLQNASQPGSEVFQ